MSDSSHARYDGASLRESLQKAHFDVKWQWAHWEHQWNTEIVALRSLSVWHCLWVQHLQVLDRNILLQMSLNCHLLLVHSCGGLALATHHVIVGLLKHLC